MNPPCVGATHPYGVITKPPYQLLSSLHQQLDRKLQSYVSHQSVNPPAYPYLFRQLRKQLLHSRRLHRFHLRLYDDRSLHSIATQPAIDFTRRRDQRPPYAIKLACHRHDLPSHIKAAALVTGVSSVHYVPATAGATHGFLFQNHLLQP